MAETLRVLIAEDSARDAELLVRELRGAGFDPVWQRVDTEAEYVEALRENLDLVLSDYNMPQFDAHRALDLLRERGLDIPFLIVSGSIGEDTAVAAMQQGAADYLLKDRLGRLGPAVRRALEQREQRALRRRAEEAVQVQAHMLNEIGQAVIGTDTEGKVIYANRFAEQLYGWTAAEMAGKHILEVTVPESGRGAAAELLGRMQKGESWSGEYLVQHRSGRVFPAFVTTSALLDERGRVAGVIGVSTDISERRRAERQQAAQHALTRVLAESSSLAAAAPGIIRAVCEAVEGQFGALWEIDRSAEVLRCVTTWHAPDTALGSLEANARSVTFGPGESLAGSVWASGKAALMSDLGEEPRFQARKLVQRAGMRCAYALPILVGGEVTGVVSALGREIRAPEPEVLEMLDSVGTQVGQFIEHRGAERQLLQAQRMEAIGQLAGGIAHDFNNLLGVILGYADLGARELGAEHRTFRRLEAIRKAAERAAALTRQILTFSRKQAVEMRVLDLNRVVEDMEKMLRRLIGEDVRLVVALGPDLGRVRADPGQIEQVIMNLAVNARDAMPSGGRLVIETANSELDELYVRGHPEVRPGPHAMLAVSDSGHGMDRETQARIFEPFFTTKEPGKGTGLGLAVVYGIVKQSGGSLSVYSEPGSGTTFKVYFPQVEAPEPTGPAARLAAAAGGSETVLVVEDEEALRAIIVETLREGGYTVLEAAEPDSALLAAAQSDRRIHLVLTDVVLPGQSGPEIVAMIRNAQPDVRVLLMSGYTDRLVGGTQGIDPGLPFISKPFTVEALLHKVREVLDLGPPASGS